MKTNLHPPVLAGAIALAILCGSFVIGPGKAVAQSAEGVEELTSGPVHEAFAASVAYDPEPGILIDRQPPGPIEELPPDQRPVGDNIEWIPGYWGWDDDLPDFIWISGVWRSLPPGRQWVPGYWASAGSQWQWTSGYWAPEENAETAYLPAPPKSLESGPNIPAPSQSHIWVSGNWIHNDTRYAWRPGYWEPAQENWVWIPAHYRWTPRGYIFVEGYWDYDVDRRGMIFAPVRFAPAYYSRPNYHYTPVTVIAINVFSHHLFVRPRYCHYYFGDYYAPRYRDRGVFASFHYHRDRRGYDPIFARDRWRHRNDSGWERRRIENFEYYRNNERARPPRTLAAFLSRPENQRRGGRDNFEIARPFSRVIADRDARQRFVRADRQEFAGKSREIRNVVRERGRIESRPAGPSRPAGDSSVTRERIARSPFVGRQPAGREAPPPRREITRPTTPSREIPGQRRDLRDTRPGPAQRQETRPTRPVPPQRQEIRPTPPQRQETRPARPVPPQRQEIRPTPPQRQETRPIRPTPPQRQEIRPTPPQRQETRPIRPAPPQRQEIRPAPSPRQETRPSRPVPPQRQQVRPAPPQRQQVRPAPPQRQQTRPAPPQRQQQRNIQPQIQRPQQAPQQRQQARPAPQPRPESGRGGGGRGNRSR